MSSTPARRTPGRPTLPVLLGRAGRDPWVLLLAALTAGLGWAAGLPWMLFLAVALVSWGTAATMKVFTGGVAPADKPPVAQVGAASEPGRLLAALDGYVEDLTRLRHSELPGPVTDLAIEALVAATSSRDTAARVAAAAEGLSQAVQRSRDTHSRSRLGRVSPGVLAAEQRMEERRRHLVHRLDSAVHETAEVYTKLLELSATASLSASDELGPIAEVSASVDSMRAALGGLEVREALDED